MGRRLVKGVLSQRGAVEETGGGRGQGASDSGSSALEDDSGSKSLSQRLFGVL